MPIQRSKSQPHKTLQEFYGELTESDEHVSVEIGKTMLLWIERLEAKLPDATIWGLTSHNHLYLMPDDTHQGEWAVKIIGFSGNYHVSYLMPRKDAPWGNAYITGEFFDFDEALAMTAKAIRCCGLWPPNDLRISKPY